MAKPKQHPTHPAHPKDSTPAQKMLPSALGAGMRDKNQPGVREVRDLGGTEGRAGAVGLGGEAHMENRC